MSFICFVSVNSRKTDMDSVLEIIQDRILIGVLVASFLFDTRRVPQAIELLKECLILLNNEALQKRSQFTRIRRKVYHFIFTGYRLISDYTKA